MMTNLNFSPNSSSELPLIDISKLWSLLNLHNLQLQLQKPSSSIENATNSEAPTSGVSQFSIDSILSSASIPKKEEEPEDDETSGTPSPTWSTTSFTLDSLQNSDRRSLGKKSSSSSSSSHRCVCDKCGKSYATTSNLSRHKQTHRALDSPHAKQCPHCDRVYVSMPALSMHILTHNASHECNVCGKRFSRLWLLQGHLRSHTGLRPFSCAQCGKSFADRSNLRAHMLTHTGDKRFECDKCGRRFALRAYLNRHLETCK